MAIKEVNNKDSSFVFCGCFNDFRSVCGLSMVCMFHILCGTGPGADSASPRPDSVLF